MDSHFELSLETVDHPSTLRVLISSYYDFLRCTTNSFLEYYFFTIYILADWDPAIVWQSNIIYLLISFHLFAVFKFFETLLWNN